MTTLNGRPVMCSIVTSPALDYSFCINRTTESQPSKCDKMPLYVGNKSQKSASNSADAKPAGGLGSEQDRERFRSVVLPYLPDAYSLARWLTGNRADAEDVVQEACLQALRGIAGFAGVNARAWLLTIVRRAAYGWLRENRASTLVMVDDLVALEEQQSKPSFPSGEGSSETPEMALIAKADAVRLESAIAALPLPFREALILRDVQEMDYREIAEVTRVPIGTVMSRLARARRRLITELAKDAP
jgi:RNA polymerase sigma-70 factor, ECF subfamily